jgi:hypothetical protein
VDDTIERTPEVADRRTEFLLKLSSDRLAGLESALEKNWIAHLILAGVGLALVFHIGSLQNLLTEYFTHGQYDQTAAASVILAVLLYYFMKLGHLLSLYVEANRLQLHLFDDYLGEGLDATKLVLRRSSSFYVQAFFSIKTYNEQDTFWPYLLVTSSIVSLAQAAALYLAAQAYGVNRRFPFDVLAGGAFIIGYFVFLKTGPKPQWQKAIAAIVMVAVEVAVFAEAARYGWASLILLFAGAVIVTLYILFWSSNRDFPQTNLAVALCPGLAMVWLLLFAASGA